MHSWQASDFSRVVFGDGLASDKKEGDGEMQSIINNKPGIQDKLQDSISDRIILKVVVGSPTPNMG